MAHLYEITVATGSKTVNVVADDEAAAKAKVTPVEGETIVSATDKGEVIA